MQPILAEGQRPFWGIGREHGRQELGVVAGDRTPAVRSSKFASDLSGKKRPINRKFKTSCPVGKSFSFYLYLGRINPQSVCEILQMLLLLLDDFPKDFSQRKFAHRVRLSNSFPITHQSLSFILKIKPKHLFCLL